MRRRGDEDQGGMLRDSARGGQAGLGHPPWEERGGSSWVPNAMRLDSLVESHVFWSHLASPATYATSGT